jgi:hypothetical protein
MNRAFVLFGIFFVLFSCRKTFHKSQPVKTEKPSIQVKEIAFDYFQGKAKIDYDDGTNQFSSPMTIRIRKDSVIWISVNPALGIEVVRALITQDSIFVIDKINKHYYALGINYVKEKFGVDVTFHMIQATLVGNLLQPIDTSDVVSFEGDFGILEQKRGNLEIRNYVSKSNQKIENIVVKDHPTSNNVTIKYSEFAPLDTAQFAYTIQLLANYKLQQGLMKSNVNINYQRAEIKGKDLRFPFNVKNKYEKK